MTGCNDFWTAEFSPPTDLVLGDSQILHVAITAVISGDIVGIQNVVDDGYDITIHDNYLLQLSCRNGRTEMAQFLIENGVDPTSSARLSLAWACRGGYVEIIRLLIQHGVDITMHDNMALRECIAAGQEGTAVFLIQNGADI